MIADHIWFLTVCFFLFAVPILLTGMNFYKLFGKKRFQRCIYDFITLIYVPLLILFFERNMLLNKIFPSIQYDAFLPYTPYAITIIALLILSAGKKIKSPLLMAILIACVFPGNILAVFHIIKNTKWYYLYTYLFYINLFMCSIRIIRNTIKRQTIYIQPKNKFMERIYKDIRNRGNFL